LPTALYGALILAVAQPAQPAMDLVIETRLSADTTRRTSFRFKT
jgi:hypothetical protein